MSQKMNREYRREMKRDEKRRTKRVTEQQARRGRRLATARQTAKPATKINFGKWLRTPYKPADLFALFLVLWGLRYGAMTWLASRPGGLEDPATLIGAGLFAQIGFGLVLVAYIRSLAREEIEWFGPAGERVAPLSAAGTGMMVGIMAWGFAYLAGRLWALLGRVMTNPLPALPVGEGLFIPGTLPALDSLASTAGMIWAAVGLLIIANALTNELFYRRVLMQLLNRVGLSPQLTILFSTFLFAISMGTTNQILSSVLAGAAFAMFYARTRATLIPVIGHLTWGVLTFLMG